MEVVISTIADNMITLGIMIGCLAVLEFLNIILGAIMAATDYSFNANTFWKGVLKALLVSLCMIVYCLVLQVLPIVFERAGITIPEDLITYAQIIAIVVVSLKKYIKGVYDKLLVLLDITEVDTEVGKG